jgi:hypothetical protein
MTERELTIRETIRRLRENIASQILVVESLSALLPKGKKEKPTGYFTDPYGKKQFYKTGKRNSKLKLITGKEA